MSASFIGASCVFGSVLCGEGLEGVTGPFQVRANMKTKCSTPVFCFVAAISLSSTDAHPGCATPARVPFKEARIYIALNQTANDLGYHISLDAEDWQGSPDHEPERARGLSSRGLQCLPAPRHNRALSSREAMIILDDFPREQLLALLPGRSLHVCGQDGRRGGSRRIRATLWHAVPNGPGGVTAALGAERLARHQLERRDDSTQPRFPPPGRSRSSATSSSSNRFRSRFRAR